MKKLIIGIVALVIAGVFVDCQPKTRKADDKQMSDGGHGATGADSTETSWTLSDKDIYFRADTVLPDMPVINDMMDMANGFAIQTAAYCDAELWFRFGNVVGDVISQLRTDIIKDPDTRAAAERYVKTLVRIMPRGVVTHDENDSVLWDKVLTAHKQFNDMLTKRYALSHYGKMTERDVKEYLGPKQFIPNYDSLYDLRKHQTEENEKYLKNMAEQTMYFDRECLFTVEYAHQQRDEEPHPAIPMLEALMTSGKFSRYLHYVWRTWRVLRQCDLSPSRDGEILNWEYNQMRFRCLNTILKQLVKHPDDIHLVNDFCYLATYDNIVRYSYLNYGNSVLWEQYLLFPEFFEKEEEES